MKKVLYISNIEVPYRVRFFNELAKYCDLTVLYEREKSTTRNATWAKSEESRYAMKYLHGINIGGENAFSLKILKEITKNYDVIIVGCYNSPVQMMAILAMRLMGISYFVNLDGEVFISNNGLKSWLKRFFLTGADCYLVAGEKAAQSLGNILEEKKIVPYFFSSLSQEEIRNHKSLAQKTNRNDIILVVGQYFDYKGMDVALDAARLDSSLRYKFVGMGTRTELFVKEHDIPENVEIIPFLQKEDLEKEYRNCAMLVLPSRQECWGLVINEAASFGTPIVSTWGSGAAVEFLADKYPQFLAEPGDANSLYQCIRILLDSNDLDAYGTYLLEKSKSYTIEQSSKIHTNVINSVRSE